MIGTVRDKGLKRYLETGDPSKLSVRNLDRLDRILARLDSARTPEQVAYAGLRFHALSGDKAGRYSVSVSGNWRLTFGWDGEDAIDVDLEDYH